MTAIPLSALFSDCPPAAVPSDPLWRLSVAQYHAMLHAGILTADDPVELLAGWLVRKMPKNPTHRAATRLLSQALERLLPTGQRDRVLKQRLYAQAGIPVYWIVNLTELQVEVYSQTSGATGVVYDQREDYPITDSVPVIIAEQRIGVVAVRDLMFR